MPALIPIMSFAFVTSITPGPNNLMLAASGFAFGVRRTLPQLLGIPAGFGLVLLLSGLGLANLLAEAPSAVIVLKVVGSAYLLYLAWVLRRAFTAEGTVQQRARPLKFVESFLFQFVNPKAWLMGLTAAALFLSDAATRPSLGVYCAIILAVNLPCISTWLAFGTGLKRLLASPRWRLAVTAGMAALMGYTVVAIWV